MLEAEDGTIIADRPVVSFLAEEVCCTEGGWCEGGSVVGTGTLALALLEQGLHMPDVLVHGQFLAHCERLVQERHGLLPVARPLPGQQHGGIMALRLRQHWARPQEGIALHGCHEVCLRLIPAR